MSRGENLLFDEKAGIDVDQERVFEDLYAADLDFGDGNFVGGSGGAGSGGGSAGASGGRHRRGEVVDLAPRGAGEDSDDVDGGRGSDE